MASIVSSFVALVALSSWLFLASSSTQYQRSPPSPQMFDRQSYTSYQISDALNDINDGDFQIERTSPSKRGFSILARWPLLGSIGRQNNVVMKTPRAPMSLVIHGKPVADATWPDPYSTGPLRWGRRR